MKRAAFAAVAMIVAALSIAAGSALADNVRFGVNDDEGMFEKGNGPFFSTLTGLGMHDNTITVRWDETSPTGFEDLGNGVTLQSFLPSAVAAANRAGVTLTFDVYPRHSAAAADPADNAPKFASWLKTLAAQYPSVTHYVVMNECNQPLFVNPQYDASGNLTSAAACGTFLAQGYQALKSVNPGIFVWGLGLSPHGAKVDGRQHRDSDPFSFLSALGTWYRSSPYAGQQLMDGLDLHPYPIPQSVPFSQGNSGAYGPAFGVATLPLVYQAFYDAFDGTAQPTVGPGRLPVSLNEVGVQTVPTVGGYTGSETPGWNISGATGSQDYQAQWYKQMIDAAQCDADVTNVNIFKLIDQPDLGAWQSGLYQLGWIAKSSAAVVQNEIETVQSCPSGSAAYWTPAGSAPPAVLPGGAGAQASVYQGSIRGAVTSLFPLVQTDSLSEFLNTPSAPSLDSLASSLLQMLDGPTTDTSGTLSVVGLGTLRAPTSARRPTHLRKSFRIRKGKAAVLPRLGTLAPGTYRLQLVLRSKAATVTLVTAPFTVDAKGKLTKAKPAKAKAARQSKPTAKKQHGQHGQSGKPAAHKPKK